MNPELIDELLNQEEGVSLDFKSAQYPFSGATDEDKSELLKDVLGFANAWRTEEAYILIGVEEVKGGRSKVVGVCDHFDDANLQQFINSKTNCPVSFSYETCTFENKQIGVIRIPLQERPVYLIKKYGKLQQDVVYIRRGTSIDITKPAKLEEVARMGGAPLVIVKRHPFEDVEPYLPRKVCRSEDAESYRLYIDEDDVTFDLAAVVERHNRVVLVCDGGAGKSTELRRLAAHYSKDGSRFHVEFRRLNTYVSQPIPELLCENWRHVPEEKLLVLLDGFDEIEAKNRNDAVRLIESFADEHPSAHIVVSTRTNFYYTGTVNYQGTLRKFETFVLLKLDPEAIESYVARELSAKRGAFSQAAQRAGLQEYLCLPFFLVRLVEIYKETGVLPPRTGVFEKLVDSSLDHDVARLPLEFRGKKALLIRGLERLALGTEALGRNYISDREFNQLMPDEANIEGCNQKCGATIKRLGMGLTLLSPV